SIKDQNGKSVAVDTEGVAKGGSQTKETVKRGGIGAGVGAIIGAIAGGGTGAAVGAIIGGSVGAGSVVVQGRDDIQLMKGSTITVQASSPVRDDRPSDN
ncbi:MAG TPA: YMGG-like glycine zipper-containing protein, partial [Pyrinomonadaceae bacterium]|nr:YMGG-like glycine zipper-containing protein [Pyrinomonadaceae bacterium]